MKLKRKISNFFKRREKNYESNISTPSHIEFSILYRESSCPEILSSSVLVLVTFDSIRDIIETNSKTLKDLNLIISFREFKSFLTSFNIPFSDGDTYILMNGTLSQYDNLLNLLYCNSIHLLPEQNVFLTNFLRFMTDNFEASNFKISSNHFDFVAFDTLVDCEKPLLKFNFEFGKFSILEFTKYDLDEDTVFNLRDLLSISKITLQMNEETFINLSIGTSMYSYNMYSTEHDRGYIVNMSLIQFMSLLFVNNKRIVLDIREIAIDLFNTLDYFNISISKNRKRNIYNDMEELFGFLPDINSNDEDIPEEDIEGVLYDDVDEYLD